MLTYADTLMITARMLMARREHALAVPLLVRVWGIRTGMLTHADVY